MILLDTNVVSEALRPAPARLVVQWLNRRFPDCAISSITVFELKAGAAALDPGSRRHTLETAIDRLIRRFERRVFAFDVSSAVAAAQLFGLARSSGQSLHQVSAKLADLQIAGIAASYGLELATRNTGDFEGLGLSMIDPWKGS